MTTTAIDKKHTDHKEEKNNDLHKLMMIESSIQENGIGESGLNFPIALITLPENLVLVENIHGKKSSKVLRLVFVALRSYNLMWCKNLGWTWYNRLAIHAQVFTQPHKFKRCLEYATTCTSTKHLSLEMVKGDVWKRNTKKHVHWRRQRS